MNYSEELKKIIDDFNNRFNTSTLNDAVVETFPNMYNELAKLETSARDIYNTAMSDGLDANNPFFKDYDTFKEQMEGMREQIEMEENYKTSVREFNGFRREETNLVRTKRPSDELGLKELKSINTKYIDLHRRHLKYREKIESMKLDPAKKAELIRESEKLYENGRKNLIFLEKEIQRKQNIEARLRKEEKDLLLKIRANQTAIRGIRGEINRLKNDPTHNNAPRIVHLEAQIKELQGKNKELKGRIDEIKKNYKILQNGGKLTFKNGPEKLDPIVEREPGKGEPKKEEPKKEAPKKETPKKEEPKKEAPKKEEPAKTAPGKTARGRRTAPGAKPKPPRPMNLETLRAMGKIPGAEFLSDKELVDICSQLNINIKDAKTVIPEDKIDRLLQDRSVQAANLYAGVQGRYQKRIAEYDKLIAKYNSMINSHSKALSPEYRKRLKGYVTRLESERKSYTDEMQRMTVGQELGNRGIERRAEKKNTKIRREYDKLDLYKEEKEMFSTDKMKKKADKKIQKTLARIEKLQGKRGKLADKQTKIVNKNSQKYIEEVEKKIDKYLSKRDKIIENVDNLQDIYDRIEVAQKQRTANAEELARLEAGKKSIKTAFRSAGIKFDNRNLKASVRRLYGKYGRTDTRMQHQVESATRHM